MLVHHDDDSGRGDAPYDKGSELAISAAPEKDCIVVSVNHDWAEVFVEPAGDGQ